jgi:hypothetical protein
VKSAGPRADAVPFFRIDCPGTPMDQAEAGQGIGPSLAVVLGCSCLGLVLLAVAGFFLFAGTSSTRVRPAAGPPGAGTQTGSEEGSSGETRGDGGAESEAGEASDH